MSIQHSIFLKKNGLIKFIGDDLDWLRLKLKGKEASERLKRPSWSRKMKREKSRVTGRIFKRKSLKNTRSVQELEQIRFFGSRR
jgi:hypothetical protein